LAHNIRSYAADRRHFERGKDIVGVEAKMGLEFLYAMSMLSFHATKVFSTIEGGALIMQNTAR
jgi:hypothetical protein